MKDGPGDADAGGLREQFDRLRGIYPPQMNASLVLPLLQIVQEQKGHVTPADAHFVADYAGVPREQAIEALSWYTMLHRQPVGRHVVKVCRNIACALRGSDRLLAHCREEARRRSRRTRPRTGASRSSRWSAWPRAGPRR